MEKQSDSIVESSSKEEALTEDQVVDVINKHRSGVEEVVVPLTVMSKKLQKDNITTDEVVKSINDHRKVQRKEIKKVPYKKFESPPLSSPLNQRKAIVDSKYEELREIFEKCGEEMEWEKIERVLKILCRQKKFITSSI
ncbi:unnamed protein product [Rhizophagus irregularis]|uniref:Uncharacterized protein n=2 Tax=Rhizophagus irregularis TaxID=588596 RepID=A0A915YTW8_9GLOM|nr:unnamed protein product [Rhizophagus irregularis]CAB5335009.1 unnamed protein product [Rhizophagus irregularis]